MLFVGTWGIGKVVESTKSVLSAACFHLIIQLLMFNAFIKDGLSLNEKLIVLGISVPIWIFLIKRWEKSQKTEM